MTLLGYTVHDGVSKRAMLEVEFLQDDGSWVPLMMQVDTAADITVVPYEFLTKLQFVGMQRPLFVREVVGSLSALQTVVRARIMGKEIDLPVISSVHIQDPLLGINTFLDNFVVTFKPEGFSVVPAR